YHPVEMREAAYEHLNELRAKLPAEHTVFAAGDFNTPSTEDQDTQILDRLVRPIWAVAHDHCTGCPGTYYYRPDENWSFLDTILTAPARGEKTTWRLRADSVRLVNNLPEQRNASGAPRGFDAETRTGVSDHWPLLIRLEQTREQ
ncbi:MAG: hypothetical protein KJO82_09715, partial [Gammaproteobacteria bacterium]|nr:hypothetical protein [Gammaproteobacteria bacterium]